MYSNFRSLAITSFLLFIPLCGNAQLAFEFSPSQTVTPGTTLSLEGELSNSGRTDVFLTGYVTSPIDPNLTLDDSPFFTDVPSVLPEGSTWSGGLFILNISSFAPAGTYSGTITLIGGVDADGQDVVASAPFTVTVSSDSPIVPEPSSTEALLIMSVLGIIPLVYHKASIAKQ